MMPYYLFFYAGYVNRTSWIHFLVRAVFGRRKVRVISHMYCSKVKEMSKRLYGHHMQEVDSYPMPPLQILYDQRNSDGKCKGTRFSIPKSRAKHQTLQSSSAKGGSSFYNSSSTIKFSANGSMISQQEYQSDHPNLQYYSPDVTYESPMSGSCITDDVDDLIRHKLRELETAMLGPDLDSTESSLNSGPIVDPTGMSMWRCILEPASQSDLKEVLVSCARAVSDDNMPLARRLMGDVRQMVSVSGEPIQRLGAYLLEGLVARMSSSGSSIYQAFRCKEPPRSELLSYTHILFEVCPYFKFGYMSANGAIAEAMKDEDRVHIIDFQIAQGSQWVTLIQAFASRPGGPPHIRITGIDDSASAYARGGGLSIVGQSLSKLAHLFNVPFEFHAAAMSGCEVLVEHLGIRPGEALAVNCAFMLHHMPDESVSTENHRDQLLRLVKSLSPKVVTLVEQESNTNTAPFFPRFRETLSYYSAMFESIDVTLPREHKERINIEQHCLARDVVNIIACEGVERVERHELLGKWRSRFTMAGFTSYPLSSLVNATIKKLLEKYSNRYRLEERDGALYLGWMDRDLVASCAWK